MASSSFRTSGSTLIFRRFAMGFDFDLTTICRRRDNRPARRREEDWNANLIRRPAHHAEGESDAGRIFESRGEHSRKHPADESVMPLACPEAHAPVVVEHAHVDPGVIAWR